MRVCAISNYNYSKINANTKPNSTGMQNATKTEFKGLKGAGIGAIGGLGYLGLASVLAGPFLPITLGVAALSAGVGALAGHRIEQSNKEDKNS